MPASGAVSTTGDPEGEITETGLVPEGALALVTGTDQAAAAGLLGGEDPRAACV